MADRPAPEISPRKQPRQARSLGLVAAVLEAAVRVLERDGAAGFTAARVAERAGVSVGSLYQYFPNKAAILFRLQADEWRRTTALLCGILEDRAATPQARLRALVHAFLRSEREEAAVRTALADAAPLYRDAAEAKDARAEGAEVFERFLAEALPGVSADERAVAGELMMATLSAVGRRWSAAPGAPDEAAARDEALADMLCAYLERLADRAG